MAMAPWRCIQDGTLQVWWPLQMRDPDYYEDKKILDSRSGGFGGEVQFGWPNKGGLYIYIYQLEGGAPTGQKWR